MTPPFDWIEPMCRIQGVTFDPSMLTVKGGVAYLSLPGKVVSMVVDEQALAEAMGIEEDE